MANVAHSTLTGADLHEPKAINTAAANTVYVANGAGSGTWQSGGTILSITGQIADFATPVAPTGWLECDGTTVARATWPDLFAALTIQQTGTRTNASPIITGLTSTTNMVIGYFAGGTGIPAGTTILTVDSPTQITLSANATSGGSGTIQISPWSLGDGSTNFVLPNAKTSGRYRRSRTSVSATRMGVSQADIVVSHQHTGTSGNNNADHTHTGSVSITGSATGTTNTANSTLDHTHNFTAAAPSGGSVGGGTASLTVSTFTTAGANSSLDHTHNFSGSVTGSGSFTTAGASNAHQHAFTTDATGGAETRPITLIVLTCIKT